MNVSKAATTKRERSDYKKRIDQRYNELIKSGNLIEDRNDSTRDIELKPLKTSVIEYSKPSKSPVGILTQKNKSPEVSFNNT